MELCDSVALMISCMSTDIARNVNLLATLYSALKLRIIHHPIFGIKMYLHYRNYGASLSEPCTGLMTYVVCIRPYVVIITGPITTWNKLGIKISIVYGCCWLQ